MDFSNYSNYLDIYAIYDFLHWQPLIYLMEALIFIWVGKKVNDFLTPSYKIKEELTEKDNKALAVSFTGYIVAVAIIILGVIESPSQGLQKDIVSIAIWSMVGILLLNVSRVINDKVILSKFNNLKEIIEDRNVGTGAVQCGTYIGTALIIRAVITGETGTFWEEVFGVSVFFIAGQIGFTLFGMIYQKIIKYDLHDEIEKDNISAGISFGMTLTAIGLVMSHSIALTDSLPAFAIYFLTGIVFIAFSRFLLDRCVLPVKVIDNEIAIDQNWGVALLEGSVAVFMAFILNALFS